MRSKFIFSLLCSILLFQGCVDDKYDLSNINTDITVFQNVITLPLGHTAGSSMGELFFDGVDEIAPDPNNAGMYVAIYSVETQIPLPDINEIIPDPVDLTFINDFGLDNNMFPSNQDVTAPKTTEDQFELTFAEDSALKEFNHAWFDTSGNFSTVDVEINVNGITVNNSGEAWVDMDVEFSGDFAFEGEGISGQIFKTKIDLTGSRTKYHNFKIAKAGVPDADGIFTVYNTTVLTIKAGTDIYFAPNANITTTIHIDDMRFTIVYGRFEVNEEEISSIDMSNFYDYVDEDDRNCFSFTEPYIVTNIVSNVGINIDASILFKPQKNNDYISGIEGSTAFPLDAATNSETTNESNIAFGPIMQESRNLPKNTDWRDVQGNNLDVVLKQMPTSLWLNSTGKATPESCDPRTTFLAQNSKVTLSYDFKIPFKLERDFFMAMRDTLKDALDKDTGKMLFTANENPTVEDKIMLFGTVESSIPLQMEMKLSALDEDNNDILVDLGVQFIKPGKLDNIVESEFEIEISRDQYDAMRKARHFKAVYSASSNNDMRNIPVTDEAMLKLYLKAKKWGGITIKGDDED